MVKTTRDRWRPCAVTALKGLGLSLVVATAVAAEGLASGALPAGQTDGSGSLRKVILEGPFGRMPIEHLVQMNVSPQGVAPQDGRLALAQRKQEALPSVLGVLRNGKPHEKRMVTKVLRHLGWPEAQPILNEMVLSPEERPAVRLGALYALGAIGDPSAGPAVLTVLDNADRSDTEKGVAIATLARLSFHDAESAIAPFAEHGNVLVRIFAIRALAVLGAHPDPTPLLEALEHDDYVVRQEACSALGHFDLAEVGQPLRKIAEQDAHASVRRAARLAVLRGETAALAVEERVARLALLMTDDDGNVRDFAVSALSVDCGDLGREALREMAENDRTILGRAVAAHLILRSGAGPRFRGGN